MRDSDRLSFQRVVLFGVVAHALDLVTTYWRDPHLLNEGNVVYALLLRWGLAGWGWLLGGKVLWVIAGAVLYRWYLSRRLAFLPPEPQPSTWHVYSFLLAGEYIPFHRYLLRLVPKPRDWAVIPLLTAAIMLPGSGAGALMFSLENADSALNGGARFIPYAARWPWGCTLSVLLVAWFLWSWRRYYQDTMVRQDAIHV